jgi:hypothetical protein
MSLPKDPIKSEEARMMSGPVKQLLMLSEEAHRKIREAQKKRYEDPEANTKRTHISGMPGVMNTLSMSCVEFHQERETGVGK